MSEPLLELIARLNPDANRETPSASRLPERVRTRKIAGRGLPRRRESYLLSPRMLYEIRQAEQMDRLTIPTNLEAVLRVSEDVARSTQVDQLHIGRALKRIEVASLGSISSDTNITVCLGDCSAEGELVPYQRCVETRPEDPVVWAQYRDRRNNVQYGPDRGKLFRRFICGRELLPTDLLTVVLRYRHNRLHVIAAYYGPQSAKLPGTTGATIDDAKWWYDPETKCGHALILTSEILPRVVKPATKICPWTYPPCG